MHFVLLPFALASEKGIAELDKDYQNRILRYPKERLLSHDIFLLENCRNKRHLKNGLVGGYYLQ